MKAAIIILVSLLGLIFPEVLCGSRSLYGNSPSTQNNAGRRGPKSLVELRQDKAMLMRTNKDRRTSSTLLNNQAFMDRSFDVSAPESNENDISNDHKLASKYIGYKCPQHANSIGDGQAIIDADPHDCAGYYYCVWGIPQTFTCTYPLLWNDSIKSCDWFFNVDCGYRPFKNSK